MVYDSLNRMTQSEVTASGGNIIKTYTYNAIGNILSKTGVGTYTYGMNAGPHAVTSAGGIAYLYNANGSMTSDGNGRTISYSPFNKPSQIVKGATTLNFTYGADRARLIQTDGSTIIHYVGKLFEKEVNGGATKFTHYIRTGEGTAAIFRSYGTGTKETRYLHRDHLGSLVAITDQTGAIVETMSYDPHGKRRNHAGWTDGTPALGYTDRGFTGHEHLDSVGLIHMNGRVYDPTLGRFVSADPFVQEPENPQNLNRYTYVDSVGKPPEIETNLYGYTMQDPVNFIDPNGESRILVTLINLANRYGPRLDRVVKQTADKAREAAQKGADIARKAAQKGKEISTQIFDRLFESGGLLNSNQYCRIGISRRGGRRTFRIAIDFVEKFGFKKIKIDLKDLGQL